MNRQQPNSDKPNRSSDQNDMQPIKGGKQNPEAGRKDKDAMGSMGSKNSWDDDAGDDDQSSSKSR